MPDLSKIVEEPSAEQIELQNVEIEKQNQEIELKRIAAAILESERIENNKQHNAMQKRRDEADLARIKEVERLRIETEEELIR